MTKKERGLPAGDLEAGFLLKAGQVRGEFVELAIGGPSWPDGGFVVRAAGRGEEREWRMAEPELDSEGNWRFKIATKELPQPTAGITVRTAAAAPAAALPAGEAWHLAQLCPLDQREFERRYTWQGQRIKDDETLRFSLIHALAFGRLSDANFISAAILFAYRSLEAENAAQCELALGFIKEALPRLDGLNATNHVRSDRDHLSISVNTALWHLCLYLGDSDRLMQALDDIFELSQEIEDAWSIGYNASKAFLLYGYLLTAKGNIVRAREVYKFTFTFFKRSAASARDTNPTLFSDFRHPHRIAFLGLVALRLFDKLSTPNNMTITLDIVVTEVFRVRGRGVVRNLRDKLAQLEAAFRAESGAEPVAVENMVVEVSEA